MKTWETLLQRTVKYSTIKQTDISADKGEEVCHEIKNCNIGTELRL